jgi:cytoskeletal protein CcmA (bactofilin family)
MRVSARALSVFCPHCHKGISLEDLRIVGSHPGKMLATCGDIVVESSARLYLTVIGKNVKVLGKIKGPVSGEESVEVGATGQVVGDIRSPKIIVREGGVIQGKCQIVTQKAPTPAGVAAGTTPASEVEHGATVAGPTQRGDSGVAKPLSEGRPALGADSQGDRADARRAAPEVGEPGQRGRIRPRPLPSRHASGKQEHVP